MLKSMRLLPICALLGVLSACNAGTETEGTSISAEVTSSTLCTNMQTNTTCTVKLSYNTGGESGLVIGYTPSQLPSFIDNNIFKDGVKLCNDYIAYNPNDTTGSCSVNIKYIGVSGLPSTQFSFTFGGKTSNAITVSGYDN